jgi:superfamily II DNA/RNA helicase
MLEAIATAFAVDVPSAALLVLPASAPVSRAVWELSELGINACSLDLTEKRRIRSSADNPTLLVSTLATTRGVDLPELSHVFVYGLPHPQKRVNAQTVDSYLHIAGRVGRFGRGGKVVTFVEDAEVVEEDEGEGKKMTAEKELVLRVLETINVERPAKFVVFD